MDEFMEAESSANDLLSQLQKLTCKMEENVRKELEETPPVSLDESIVPYVPSSAPSLQSLSFLMRKKTFTESIQIGEVFIGLIHYCDDPPDTIHVDLLATDSYRNEVISDLELTAVCLLDQATPEMRQFLDSPQPPPELTRYVRVVVTAIALPEITVSAKVLGYSKQNTVKLGLLTSGEVPKHCFMSSKKGVTSVLESDPMFYNPDSVANLVRDSLFLHPEDHDSLTFAQEITTSFPKESYAASLVKKQITKVTNNLVRDGFDAYNNLRILQAVQSFNKALKNDPNCHKAYQGLAMTFGREGYWEKAIEHLEKALSLNSDCQEYKDDLYMCYVSYATTLKNQDQTRARTLLRKACELDFERQEAHEVLSQLGTSYPECSARGWPLVLPSTPTNPTVREKFSIYNQKSLFKSVPFSFTEQLKVERLLAISANETAHQSKHRAVGMPQHNSGPYPMESTSNNMGNFHSRGGFSGGYFENSRNYTRPFAPRGRGRGMRHSDNSSNPFSNRLADGIDRIRNFGMK